MTALQGYGPLDKKPHAPQRFEIHPVWESKLREECEKRDVAIVACKRVVDDEVYDMLHVTLEGEYYAVTSALRAVGGKYARLLY